MAKSSKKKKKKSPDPEIAARNKKIALASAVLLGAGAIFVGAGMGIRTLDQRAQDFVAPGQIEFEIVWGASSSGTIWLPFNERSRLNALVRESLIGARPLRREPLQEASLAIASTGWVNGAPEARWTEDGRIVLHADWRVPAAAVLVDGQEVLVDWDGHVLPLSYPKGSSNQFQISNTALPDPGVGRLWDEPELRDALRLLRELRDRDLLAQVTGVDLGQGREHGILKLTTNSGAKVIWGGGPGRERPAEMPTDVKLDRLESLLRKTGRIDASMASVDVRGPQVLMDRREN